MINNVQFSKVFKTFKTIWDGRQGVFREVQVFQIRQLSNIGAECCEPFGLEVEHGY